LALCFLADKLAAFLALYFETAEAFPDSPPFLADVFFYGDILLTGVFLAETYDCYLTGEVSLTESA